MVVALSSSDTSEATVRATITILANQASANFAIDAVNDSISDGIQTTTFTASATGFNSGFDTIDVSDIDVPDLQVSKQLPMQRGRSLSINCQKGIIP